MEYYIGQIQLFGFSFAPRNWAVYEGQLLPITEFQALYALIGNQFGGDGRSTFAMPDLKGAQPLPNLKFYMAITGNYPTRT